MQLPVIEQLSYQWRLYHGMRSASRAWSPERDMAALPFPKLIQLQTINACQAACRMCPYPLMKGVFPKGRMDDALFDKVIAEIAARPEVESFVPMLQNEPFLDKQLFEKIARFKAMAGARVRVELVTNGAFLTDENIGRIRASGLDLLDISLDAVSREVYRKIRVGLDFDHVIAGVERVIAAKLPHTKVFVRLIRLRQNLKEVRAFTHRWRAL
ncbi:MAG TPA: radical SAM protein, partial [Gemmatimonadales bacterium]|nr:radical SAM protein [Gemmatimonadales bacterium]